MTIGTLDLIDLIRAGHDTRAALVEQLGPEARAAVARAHDEDAIVTDEQGRLVVCDPRGWRVAQAVRAVLEADQGGLSIPECARQIGASGKATSGYLRKALAAGLVATNGRRGTAVRYLPPEAAQQSSGEPVLRPSPAGCASRAGPEGGRQPEHGGLSTPPAPPAHNVRPPVVPPAPAVPSPDVAPVEQAGGTQAGGPVAAVEAFLADLDEQCRAGRMVVLWDLRNRLAALEREAEATRSAIRVVSMLGVERG